MTGLSVSVAIGKPVLVHFQANSNFWRLAFGPFAVHVWFFDLDAFMCKVSRKKELLE